LGDLVKGNIYLIEEEKLERTPALFLKEIKGKRGLIITRQPLDKIDDDGRLESFPHQRLSLATAAPGIMSPHNISGISYKVSDFIAEITPGIIMLEGFEYLSTQTGFNSVLRLLQFIYDKVSGSNCIVLVSLNPLAFTQKEFHQIKIETVKAPESYIEQEMEIEQVGMLKARP
jgi:hypothetical protein